MLYRLLAYVGVAAILFALGFKAGYVFLSDKVEAERVSNLEQSRIKEQKLQDEFNLNARNLANVLNSTVANRDRIIERLRNDQNHSGLPKDPGTNCPSTDWRTIPAEMGAEVIREVSERDQYREGLISCYQALDSLH